MHALPLRGSDRHEPITGDAARGKKWGNSFAPPLERWLHMRLATELQSGWFYHHHWWLALRLT